MLNAAQRDAVQRVWQKTDAQTALDVQNGVISPRHALAALANLRGAIASLDLHLAELLEPKATAAAAGEPELHVEA